MKIFENLWIKAFNENIHICSFPLTAANNEHDEFCILNVSTSKHNINNLSTNKLNMMAVIIKLLSHAYANDK